MKPKYSRIISELIVGELTGGARLTFHVTSKSMSPFLKEGDEVVVCRCHAGALRRGDIVVFIRDDDFYIHRYMGKKLYQGRALLLAKADASRWFDEPVKENCLIGKVVRVRRKEETLLPGSKKHFLSQRIKWFLSYAHGMMFSFMRSLREYVIHRGMNRVSS